MNDGSHVIHVASRIVTERRSKKNSDGSTNEGTGYRVRVGLRYDVAPAMFGAAASI